MDAIIARHYAHYPLAALPGFVRAALARRWRERSEVLYIEARDGAGRFCGFVFAQSLGARPWRQLMARPRWTLPFAAFARARRLWHQKRNPVAPPPAIDRVASSATHDTRPFTTVEFSSYCPRRGGRGSRHGCWSGSRTSVDKSRSRRGFPNSTPPRSRPSGRRAGMSGRPRPTS